MSRNKTPNSVTLDKALTVVCNMESMAQTASERVQGLCSLALHALETPQGQKDVDALSAALWAIMSVTGETADCLANEAERVAAVLAATISWLPWAQELVRMTSGT